MKINAQSLKISNGYHSGGNVGNEVLLSLPALMDRDRILINHSGFSAPLLRSLEGLGLMAAREEWAPAPELLERSAACFVWFYDCLRHPVRIWRLKRRLARHGVPLVAWNQDAPHYLNFVKPARRWRLDALDVARLLDIYATHTLIDERRRFADMVLYLPNAADTTLYDLRGDPTEVLERLRDPTGYSWDVSFFGGMDGNRYKEDRARQDFFSALAERLDTAGISHRFVDAGDGNMPLEDQVGLIRASRINLNFGARCECGIYVASGLPERCYGIPACGGFLLCDKRIHSQDDFTPGDNWAEFDGLDDCVAKIEHWLAHFDAARNLAERCHHHVMTHHTYAHRARKLHEALLAWHDGQRGLIK